MRVCFLFNSRLSLLCQCCFLFVLLWIALQNALTCEWRTSKFAVVEKDFCTCWITQASTQQNIPCIEIMTFRRTLNKTNKKQLTSIKIFFEVCQVWYKGFAPLTGHQLWWNEPTENKRLWYFRTGKISINSK